MFVLLLRIDGYKKNACMPSFCRNEKALDFSERAF